jgi:hypothetical protein
MGYLNLLYTLADDAAFGVITATGAQDMPRAAAKAAPSVCLARAPPAGISKLVAANASAPATEPVKSVVLMRTPALYTMEWDIDAERCVPQPVAYWQCVACKSSLLTSLLGCFCHPAPRAQRRGAHHAVAEWHARRQHALVRHRHPQPKRRAGRHD